MTTSTCSSRSQGRVYAIGCGSRRTAARPVGDGVGVGGGICRAGAICHKVVWPSRASTLNAAPAAVGYVTWVVSTRKCIYLPEDCNNVLVRFEHILIGYIYVFGIQIIGSIFHFVGMVIINTIEICYGNFQIFRFKYVVKDPRHTKKLS